MRTSAIFFTPLLLLSVTAMAGKAPSTAASILTAAKVASGGPAWDHIHSIRQTGTARIFGLKGPMKKLEDLDTGSSVRHVALDLGSIASGHDGKTIWARHMGGEVMAQTAPHARARAVTRSYLTARGYWHPHRWPAKDTLLGERTLHGHRYQVVRVTPMHGAPAALWFDARTHLLARQVVPTAMGTSTTTFSDYRVVDGVKISFRSETTERDNHSYLQVQTTTLNVPAPSGAFAVPDQAFNDITFAHGGTSATIPFTLVAGHLIGVHASVNGHPVRLMLDTGGAEILSPAVARSLKLKMQGGFKQHGWGANAVQSRMARVKTLTLGDEVTLHHQVFKVVPLGAIPKMLGGNMAGLLGYEIFHRFVVRIDYAHKTLTLTIPSAFVPKDAGKAMPLTFTSGLPEVAGSLDGLKGQFTFDTGMGATLNLWSPYVKAHHLLSRYKTSAPIQTGGGIGGGLQARIAQGHDLMLGSTRIKDPVFFLTRSTQGALTMKDAAGNVGGGILRRFTVTFDYPHKRMYLKPNGQFKPHQAIHLPADALKKFVGRYQVRPHVTITIARKGDQLSIQLPGQSAFQMYPESPTGFFLKVTDAQIQFELDAHHRATGLVLHQGDRHIAASKIDTKKAAGKSSAPHAITLSPKQLQRFVGAYRIAPGAVLKVTRHGDQLEAQLTGQPAAPIYPASGTEFFYKIVKARIAFVTDAGGDVTGLVLHQAGRSIPGKRTR